MNLTEAVYARMCPRCSWRYLDDRPYCPDCMDNPTWDRAESSMLANNNDVFEFMGWRFKVNPVASDGRVYLMCFKRLFNPELAGEVYSQSNFNAEDYDHSLYRALPPRREQYLKKYCAAWLIAHWWEHYTGIRPCLHGDRNDSEDSPFRKAMIESLLWYDAHLKHP
jgi:hypothetical protein